MKALAALKAARQYHEEAERAIAQMTIEGHTIFAGYKTKEYDERGWW